VAEGLSGAARASRKSIVRVMLTQAGLAKLDALAETHLQELAQLAPTMHALWRALEPGPQR
jgi:hypothetical protein